ncbi:MAG: Ribonuclease VapC9 [Methanoregula sp. PtaU1.Bin051]|nr:MAG: Ribonuclease VapC9 [Methanoregula sp. PtaU1.Bin051]
MSVLLDTNALMAPAQFRIDLFDELRLLLGSFEPLVLEDAVKELTGISSGSGRDSAAARYGLALAEKCTIVNLDEPVHGGVDDQVIAYADKTRCYVVTNDRHLRKALLARGIGVISMRKQKRLELIQS